MRLPRRNHPPGTSPGTIRTSAKVETPFRAFLTQYSAGDIQETEITNPEVIDWDEPGRRRWLDIEGFDADFLGGLGQHLGIHQLAVEDVVNAGQRPKMDEYEDSIFIVIHHLQRPSHEETVAAEQVSFLLRDGVVATFRQRPSTVFDLVRSRLRSGKGKMRAAGTDYLVYALVDAVIDHYFLVLDDLGEKIENAEESLIREPNADVVHVLHSLRQDIVQIRRSVWPLRDLFNRLIRTENPLIQQETKVFLRDVADHVAVVADMVEVYREIVAGLMDLHFSNATNRLNEVMKFLTMIATIFIPLSFIAGVYGMNFNRVAGPLNMPELDWYWGYPAVLLLMLLMAGGLLLFFRRRGWLS